jgi:hypothetical protein
LSFNRFSGDLISDFTIEQLKIFREKNKGEREDGSRREGKRKLPSLNSA